jgi:hypothetical protein
VLQRVSVARELWDAPGSGHRVSPRHSPNIGLPNPFRTIHEGAAGDQSILFSRSNRDATRCKEMTRHETGGTS